VDKVAKVRDRTSGSDPPIFSQVPSGASFRSFLELSIDDVISAIHRLPDKSSAADPLPTPVLKQVADLIAPFLTTLFNHSLATGHYPAVFKEAFITPIVKKAGMDAADVNSYRPISNLPVISKLFERLVARQLMYYLTAADLLPARQSGFRPGHSTETAILRVLSDILQSVDRGDVAVLILLDLSAAFDTVDHDILLQRLQCSFGIDDSVLSWLQSYLCGRTQYVFRGHLKSSTAQLVCGVPQGSVLGPLLFILYTADLVHLIERFSLSAQLYADDTQVYGSCQPSEIHRLSSSVIECISAVSDWMKSNRLQLNPDKTEVLWCTTGLRQHQLPTTSFKFGGVDIKPAASVRNLGVFLDTDLVMRTHVSKVVARCFGVLRQLRQIRHLLCPDTLRTLVTALVLSRLDYCNSVLVGAPAYLMQRLQSVLNASVRLICRLRRFDHLTDAMACLHWLRVTERVQFKLAVLTYKVLHGGAPSYLGPLARCSARPGSLRLRSAASDRLQVPQYKLKTIGGRMFPVAAPTVWNSLPSHVTSAPSLSVFRRRLKTFLFPFSYPDLLI
jgi:hypothetical protein